MFAKEHGKANVTSLLERKSRYTVLLPNPDRRSARVIGSIREALSELPDEA
jgi:transposase, IS30 family